jgi:phosphoribosylformylglycinamidine synthase
VKEAFFHADIGKREIISFMWVYPIPAFLAVSISFRKWENPKEDLWHSRTIAGGGLAVALAKESVSSGIGVEMKLNVPTRKDVFLFGEGGPRAIYAVPPHKVVEFLYTWRGYPLIMLAKAGGTSLSIQGHMDIEVSDLQNLWRNDQ